MVEVLITLGQFRASRFYEHKVILLAIVVTAVVIFKLFTMQAYTATAVLVFGILVTVAIAYLPRKFIVVKAVGIILIILAISVSSGHSPQIAAEYLLFGFVISSFISVRMFPWLGLATFLAIVVASSAPLLRILHGHITIALITVVGSSLVLLLQVAEVSEKLNEYRHLSIYDALTNLHNMRYFRYKLNLFFQDASVRTVTLCLFDIDYFKHVNDILGHREGDAVLQRFAHVISDAAEPAVVSRYGGEEFVIILPNCPVSKALELAEHVRSVVEKTSMCPLHLTVSCGIAESPITHMSPDALFDEADKALYDAKSIRNCVKAGQI